MEQLLIFEFHRPEVIFCIIIGLKACSLRYLLEGMYNMLQKSRHFFIDAKAANMVYKDVVLRLRRRISVDFHLQAGKIPASFLRVLRKT